MQTRAAVASQEGAVSGRVCFFLGGERMVQGKAKRGCFEKPGSWGSWGSRNRYFVRK